MEKMMKKIIEDESDSIEVMYSKPTLDDVIAKLQKIREVVPGDAKAYSWVDGYDDDEFHINFHFKREETDEEYNERTVKEFAEARRKQDDEVEMYRRLKAKFEGGK